AVKHRSVSQAQRRTKALPSQFRGKRCSGKGNFSDIAVRLAAAAKACDNYRMLGMDQQRRFCTLLAVALVMGAVATAEGAAGVPGSSSGAAHEAVRQIRMVDRDALVRWISELAQPKTEKP